jgi:ABC-2 type transport system permease protein
MKLLKYDFFYLYKTYKFIIFPAVAIVFAILSPLTAFYINELLDMLSVEGGPVITLPDPTVIDSYAQYISNLVEIFLIVAVFVSVSAFIREKTKGYFPLIISKPINRVQYLLSKYIAMSLLILATLVISGLVFGLYTYIIFGEISFGVVTSITLLYMVYVLFILSISMLFSQLFNNYAAASILTFVGYIFFNILGGFEKGLLEYLPGRIIYRITEDIVGIENTETMLINVGVTLAITFGLLVLSIVRFKKYDLN